MRPILMKGHERPLTFLKYNREGDLLFSCAKDNTPTVWFADNGERLGTYKGHNGAVWCCDVSRDSTRLITGCADQTAKLWDVQTGAQLYTFNFDSPVRAVDFSVGDKLAVITTDPFMEHSSSIQVKRIARDISDRDKILLNTFALRTPTISSEPSARTSHVVQPRDAMEFANVEDAKTFCNAYTRSVGFGTSIIKGVNHHEQYVLLSCALLSNEKTQSFIWVFKYWLETNGGQSLKVIITDQDKAIEVVVVEVFL